VDELPGLVVVIAPAGVVVVALSLLGYWVRKRSGKYGG